MVFIVYAAEMATVHELPAIKLGHTIRSQSPVCEKDFCYVDDEEISGSDGSRNSDQKSELSVASTGKKSRHSSGSSYAHVLMADFEPRMDRSEYDADVVQLVREAQLDDINFKFFSDADMSDSLFRRGSAPLFSESESTSGEEEAADLRRSMSESAYSKDSCVLFHGVTYFGSATINSPVNELELKQTISRLRNHAEVATIIILGIGLAPSGDIRLIDPETRTDVASYRLQNICFWGRGDPEKEMNCFAFNISHGVEDHAFHCHVFQCQAEEVALKVIQSLVQTLKKEKKRNQLSARSLRGYALDPSNLTFKFDIMLDVWEEDSKGSYQTAARDRSYFKLREGLQKKVVLVIDQLSNRRLHFERCSGLFLAAGREVNDKDMHALEYVQLDPRPGGRVVISGHWDPTHPQWKLLNAVSAKDARVSFTVVADVLFEEVKQPIRITREFRLKIYPSTEKFWNPAKPRISETYVLDLKESVTEAGERSFELASLLSASELEKRKTQSHSSGSLASFWRSKKAKNSEVNVIRGSIDAVEDEEDEALLSGSGIVEKEPSSEDLSSWHDALLKWNQSNTRPKQLIQLVRKGVLGPIRGQIWQRLVGLEDDVELLISFCHLANKDCAHEQVILWDITRTFPAHDHFKDAGGDGQTSLYKISKAYASYDEEVGYCQGMSFLIAVLLLHMPEEQAFCVLVKIMFDYGHRELFKNNFDALHQSFYVLERAMEESMSDLHQHFRTVGVELHMFASQWFLTLFTAKFPLGLVYQIMDILLCEGCDVMFQIALAFLKESKKDLLQLDFEGVLKYFRVSLPKRYLDEEQMKQLINSTFSFKVSKRRLEKYKQEYVEWKNEMQWKEDPLSRMQRENRHLMEQTMRLERENDNLAHELVTTQVVMQERITDAEERVNQLSKELENMRQCLFESEEEISRLKSEEVKIKEVWRQATESADLDRGRKERIIEDYKQILSRMEEGNEKLKREMEIKINAIRSFARNCPSCFEAFTSCNTAATLQRTPGPDSAATSFLFEENPKDRQLRELEAELIQTKMALAEAKHRSDELEMKLHNMAPIADKPWYKKVAISGKR